MWKRLARKPSTASLMPAARNNEKAMRISPSVIAQTTIGTSKIRPKVIRFGMLKLSPASSTLARPWPRVAPFANPAVILDSRRAIVCKANYSGAPACLHTPRFRRRRREQRLRVSSKARPSALVIS